MTNDTNNLGDDPTCPGKSRQAAWNCGASGSQASELSEGGRSSSATLPTILGSGKSGNPWCCMQTENFRSAPEPGVLQWTAPSGRRYTTHPGTYLV
jgi:hypothetical protein